MDTQRMLPEFIQKRKDLKITSQVSSARKWQQYPNPGSITQSQSLGFWRHLNDELRFTLSATQEIDIKGSISPFGEDISRITLSDHSLPPIATRTDIVLDGERIRCSVLNGGIYYLDLVIFHGTEIFAQDIQADDTPMNAQKTAEYVISRMVNIIEWMRRSSS
jgi:hypothetical protein